MFQCQERYYTIFVEMEFLTYMNFFTKRSVSIVFEASAFFRIACLASLIKSSVWSTSHFLLMECLKYEIIGYFSSLFLETYTYGHAAWLFYCILIPFLYTPIKILIIMPVLFFEKYICLLCELYLYVELCDTLPPCLPAYISQKLSLP